jgi:hypothetical protein
MTQPMRRTCTGLLVATAALLAACGGADQPAYCQDRDDLQESISGLADVDVGEGGVEAVTDLVAQVRADANALAGSTRDQFGQQSAALRSAAAALGQAVRDAAAEPTAQAAGDVADQARATRDAFTALSDDLESTC